MKNYREIEFGFGNISGESESGDTLLRGSDTNVIEECTQIEKHWKNV